ncbi:MAG TPA: hypothetical protein VNN80_23725 [Polyangiaceae bacterium]|nr:hypothetical protein [Polyangiaceae bacterium]
MRVQVAIPESHVKKPVLDAALEATTRLNESLLKSGSVPTFSKAKNRIRWQPEPPGEECFDHAGIVMARKVGDCDDLASWHAASLRHTGEDPGARAVVKRSGPKLWHAIVQRSNGAVDDPSIACGMPRRGSGVHGAVVPVMFGPPDAGAVSGGTYVSRPQLAMRPLRSRNGEVEAWQARADLPWHWEPETPSPTDLAMVSLHRTPVSSQALVGACRGAVRLAEASGFADEDDLDRVSAIADCCEGASWEELAEEYGPDHATAAGALVGSFFGGLKRSVKKLATKRGIANMAMLPFGGRRVVQKLAPIALPLASKALPFVPGVGPAAALALQYATPMLQRAIAERRHEPPEIRQQPPGTQFFSPDQFAQFQQYAPGYGGQVDPYAAAQAAQYFGAMPFR